MPADHEQPSRSLAEEAVLSLEQEIVEGRLRPRERLIELDIAARMGVSRAPIREALRSLERDGLVMRSGQSFVVADISLEEATDIFEIVAFLEDLYTRRATPHLTPTDIRGLRAAVKEMGEVAKRNDVKGYDVVNRRFHRIIREACPSKALIDIVESLGKRTLRFRRFAMTMPDHLPKSREDHAQILRAIESGDAVAAGRQAARTARETFKRLAKVLKYASIIS